ncbi:MAG: hypothetical protein SP4CHLAM5_09370 [Chlamydiia bacterium]|nr:hypothetical protein [Chlamydiia bacterium]MCH9618796.1 hypothetical protein [Chlamydiia bacterium]MCH9624611.1 hypothetical protein [Chlamydiia bacterium]
MRRIYIGESEHEIYEMIEAKGEVTVREVYEMLGLKSKYTTVMTIMNRMVEKGELQRRRNGIRYVYTLNKKSESKACGILSKIKHSLFEGKTRSMVSYLLEEDKDISTKELEQIEEIIATLKSEK